MLWWRLHSTSLSSGCFSDGDRYYSFTHSVTCWALYWSTCTSLCLSTKVRFFCLMTYRVMYMWIQLLASFSKGKTTDVFVADGYWFALSLTWKGDISEYLYTSRVLDSQNTDSKRSGVLTDGFFLINQSFEHGIKNEQIAIENCHKNDNMLKRDWHRRKRLLAVD